MLEQITNINEQYGNLLGYGLVAYLGIGVAAWASRDLYNHIKTKLNKNKNKDFSKDTGIECKINPDDDLY